MRALHFASVFVLIGAQPAFGQVCASYEGQTVSPASIDTVISTVSELPAEKDEFETTEQFNARVQASLGNLEGAYVVGTMFDAEHAVYDADNQRFNIKSYALDNMNASWEAIFGYGRPLYERVKYSSFGNVDIIVSNTERVTGSYRASNAFGASATISEVSRVNVGIFDREAAYGEDLFFRNREEGRVVDQVIGTIAADPVTARNLKDTMRGAVVIVPKAPWYAVGDKSWGAPTISNPQDVTETVSAVIADIQCALVLDGSNRVLLAVQTR